MFSTPLGTLSFGTLISLDGSCFVSPFTGSKTGEDGGLMRTTFSFFSSIYFPLSFANCQKRMNSKLFKKKQKEKSWNIELNLKPSHGLSRPKHLNTEKKQIHNITKVLNCGP